MPFEYESDLLYCKIVHFIINAEGSYVNDPNDPGGPTKFGIASYYNGAILKSMGVDDVFDLTLEQAKQIYYTKYWKASKADKIQNARLAYIHTDSAINCGVAQAAVFLTRT